MKKITLLLLFLFISISGYSQLALEGFENTTGPDATPSTNWTLGTGNWAVFDNGLASNVRWGINSTVATPPIVHQGINSAYVNRENIGAGNTSEEYLSTPPVLIPANGVLHFYTRMFTSGNQGTIYQIKVAPATASQTDPFAYSLVQQWTEDELIIPTTNFNIYTEKTIDLSAFATQFVYVSFVKIFTQPDGNLGGDRWLIDDVSIDSPCLTPTGLASSAITANGATLNWVNPNGTGTASWEIEVVLASGTPTGVANYTTTTFPYVVTGLLPNTTYKFYVRAICTTGFSSPWSVASANFTTSVAPPVCGGNYVDAGGISGNYANNTAAGTGTTLICPQNTGDLVTVAFTSFNTEAVNDILKIYSGDSAATGTLLGTYSGTTLPPTFTSGAPSGCLTLVFTSNATVTAPGWLANVTCAPAPACQQPLVLTAGAVTSTTIPLSWTNAGSAMAWQVLALPCGSPAPTSATTGWISASSNPYTLTGLTSATCYTIYVRSDCGTNGVSTWSAPISVTTLAAPAQCGGNYVDNGGLSGNYTNNTTAATGTTTICPSPSDVVTVTFTSFNTEAANDVLKIYNGTGTAGTLLGTFSGVTLPPSIISSAADGCLTFVFTSNATVTAPGWVSNITCGPPPACPKPVALTTSGVSATSVSFGWTAVGSATSWQVLALPCTDPAPTSTTTGWVATSTSPYVFASLNTGTCYNFYVRSDCGGVTGLSEWAGPQPFTTAVPGFTCAAPIVVGTLPYTTTDNTANYGDNAPIEGSPGASGCGSTNNYLNGNDVVYAFTPTFTGTINVAMTPTATYSGIFAYTSCANIGVSCTAGVANFGTSIRTFDLPVTAGSTYYFVISTWATPQTTAYTLVINQINCTQPTNATVASITSNSALSSWGNPGASTSWEVAVQPAGTGVPIGSGITSTINTNFPLAGLTPLTSYEYYVRADCGNGTFSLWTGPVPFTTAAPPPACGGNFYDTGGPNGTYQNSEDSTVVICPPTGSGNTVTVTFSQFVTEPNYDGLYVFDGNSITAPQIPSTNGAGNVPGGLAGSFWGTLTGANLPGPFTSSDSSGCLTFRFRSDTSGNNYAGWAANVTCSPAPNCAKPTLLTVNNITATSALLGWTESNSAVQQWEIYYVTAGSPAPLPTATGTLVSNNPALITGLQPGTQYIFYVRAICPTSGTSAWSSGKNFLTLVINDDCSGALFAPVNSSSVCQQIITGTIAGATASTPGINSPCIGTADDDVWFQFIATNTYLNISLQNVTGSTTNLNYAVYSGQCGTLTQVFCSPANALSNVVNSLTIGQTYFIRVYSFANTPQTSTFDLCITTPSTCSNSNTICNLLGENTPSTLGVSSLGTIGCLGSSPDPTFYTLEVATTGPINLFLSQNALPNGQGAGRDIDYAAWGPFTSQAQACSVVGNQAPFAPPGIGVPVTQTTGCSFSAASTETLNIANALAGQIYIILITNYSQQSGFINLTQTNFGQPGAGTVSCCPEAFFKYLPASYCKASGAPNPVAVITAGSLSGVFSSPYTPGLVFANTATGEIDLAASAPGNYVIVNTVLASGTCQQKVRTYTINISEPTSAIINYGSPSYCKSVTALQAVSQTGTPGGSYSAIPNIGLSINPTTGDINPSLSSPGVYTVIYGLPGSICTTGNPSTQVEIIALPNIVQPAPVVVCNSYSLQPITVGNYYSQPNGAGTPLDINVPLISSQLVYIYAVNSNGCSNEKSFSVTINSVPAPTYTSTPSSCSLPTGTITVTPPTGGSGPLPADLFISEVTDATTGQLTYVELFNGTGAPVNLANYKLKFYTWGSPPTAENLACNLQLAGTIANNSTNVIKVSGDANASGVAPNQTFTGCGGVNNNDNIRLTTASDVEVDVWGVTDGSTFTPSGQAGYTYRRNTSAIAPSTTWNPADWSTTDPEDYTLLGSYPFVASNYQYSLDNGAFTSGTFFNNLAVGDHILIVKDLTTGCLSAPVTITIAPLNPITAVTTFDYQPTAVVCQNATTNPIPNTSATGFTFGGTFSEDTNLSTGLVFVSTLTGEIDLANSTPGIHTVIYKVIDQPSSCLTGTQSSATIEIKPIITPVIGFSYPVSICKNALPTLLAPLAPGLSSFAMFSVTPPTGLAINSTTGVIDLANSTAGMYDIVVTVAADSNTCRVSATTAPAVSLEIKPVVTLETGFGYNAPLCANNGTELPNPNPGFATGGTYTSTPPGLIINSSTGAIDLTSTPGPYTVTYMVNPVVSNCEVSTPGTTQVTIVPPVSIELTGGCQSVKYVLTATPVNGSFVPETATFAWHNALGVNVGSTQSIEVPATGIYTVTVTVAGCDTVSAPFPVDSIICVIQKGISVNNDGLNDTFDLRGFNVKKLTLFNRYGMKVYSLENYTNEWGGKSDKGDELPDGTYYYIIDRNNGETKTGWIYINRAQ